MIVVAADHAIRAKFIALRTELADLAYELECQGRCDAADITNQLNARLAEFADQLNRTALPGQNNASASCSSRVRNETRGSLSLGTPASSRNHEF